MKDDAIPPRRAWQKSLEWGKSSKNVKNVQNKKCSNNKKHAQTTKQSYLNDKNMRLPQLKRHSPVRHFLILVRFFKFAYV